jgi:hypothetical protein
VGKNPILLDACSILTVYSGVDGNALALTNATAKDTTATPITTRYSFFFISSPPFWLDIYGKRYYKYFL